MSFLTWLCNRSPINGDKGYARGAQAAREFLATDPPLERREAHWRLAACKRDDYDRGYHDVLRETF